MVFPVTRSPISDFGDQIAHARQQKGMAQSELAERAGISRQALYQIEHGQVLPRVDTALRLAALLGISLDQFTAGHEELPATALPVSLLGPAPEAGARLDIARVGERWIAAAADTPLRIGAGIAVADGSFCRKPAGTYAESYRDPAALEQNVFLAGCDPALQLLAERASVLARKGRCIWLPKASLAALKHLAEGEVHVAGIHFADERNLQEIERLGLAQSCMVVRFSRWQQGWMLARSSARGFRGIDDLGEGRLRLVNRDAGSGCRQELDLLLAHHGIKPSRIPGYQVTTPNHTECARRIAMQQADVGLGCESIARAFGLKFSPLSEVAFDLVIRREFLHLPVIQAMLEALNAATFASELNEIPGYDSAQTGKVLLR